MLLVKRIFARLPLNEVNIVCHLNENAFLVLLETEALRPYLYVVDID